MSNVPNPLSTLELYKFAYKKHVAFQVIFKDLEVAVMPNIQINSIIYNWSSGFNVSLSSFCFTSGYIELILDARSSHPFTHCAPSQKHLMLSMVQLNLYKYRLVGALIYF